MAIDAVELKLTTVFPFKSEELTLTLRFPLLDKSLLIGVLNLFLHANTFVDAFVVIVDKSEASNQIGDAVL